MAHSRGSSILGFPEAYPIGLSMLIQARHPMTFVPRWVPLNRRPAMDTWRWEAGKCFDPKMAQMMCTNLDHQQDGKIWKILDHFKNWNRSKTPSFHHMAMDQYLLIPFLGGWTSIYQLFWGSLGTRVLTHPHIWRIPFLPFAVTMCEERLT